MARLVLACLVALCAASADAQSIRLPSGAVSGSTLDAFTMEAERLLGSDQLASARIGLWEAGDADGVLISLVDPALSDVPSGVLTRPAALARDLAAMRDVLGLPMRRLGVVAHPSVYESAGLADRLRALASQAGWEDVLMVGSGAASLGAMDVEGLDAVYLDAGSGLSVDAIAALAERLAEQGTVSLAAEPDHVRAGWLLSASPPFYERLGRDAALAVQDVSEGRSVEATDRTRVLPPVRFTANERTAQRLGVDLPWTLRLEAQVIEADTRLAAPLTLADAVRIAADSSLATRAEAFAVRADAQNVGLARSAILPQIGLESTARVISDELGAAALGGANPERLWTVGAGLDQVLFSERAFADVAITTRIRTARRYQLAAARLDAAQAGADAFVALLRAQTGEAITRATLRRTRVNVEAARLRRTIGTAGPADVARLEAEAAQNRARLAGVMGGVQAARVSLNQTLNRPLDQRVAVGGADSGGASEGDAPLRLPRAFAVQALTDAQAGRAASPGDAARLADLAAVRAYEQAPEIEALRSIVSAQRRADQSAGRSFFLPEIRLSAGATTRLYEGGAGTEALPPQLPIPPFPDDVWQIGVTASFPLFLGGARLARKRQTQAEMGEAQAQLDQVVQGVETGARASAHVLSANAAAFEQALLAADAAAEAYRVAERLYREGLVDLLGLLDAQTALRVSEELAADAAYDVVEASIDLQRATARFAALERSIVTDPERLLD